MTPVYNHFQEASQIMGSRIGQRMKPRGKQQVSAMGVQAEASQEPVQEVVKQAQTPNDLESGKLQNLESVENEVEAGETSGVAAETPEISSLSGLLESSKDATRDEKPKGRDENGVPSVVGLGDGTITKDGEFVAEGERVFSPELIERLKKQADQEDEIDGTIIYRRNPDGTYTQIEGGMDIGPSKSEEQRLAELICQHNGYVGEREDGSYGVVVTIGEGYWGAVKEWAESDGLTAEEWLTNLVTTNIESYGMPAKGR